MSIILIGPPGAGKGTQAHKVSAKPAIPHISAGAVFRESVSVGSKLGMAATHHPETGELVPSDFTTALAADRISQFDCRRIGFILNGDLRSLEQAQTLSCTLTARETSIDNVLNFQVCEDALLMRLKGRGRADDTDEVIQIRLKVHREQTAPLLDYYGNKLVTTDGVSSTGAQS